MWRLRNNVSLAFLASWRASAVTTHVRYTRQLRLLATCCGRHPGMNHSRVPVCPACRSLSAACLPACHLADATSLLLPVSIVISFPPCSPLTLFISVTVFLNGSIQWCGTGNTLVLEIYPLAFQPPLRVPPFKIKYWTTSSRHLLTFIFLKTKTFFFQPAAKTVKVNRFKSRNSHDHEIEH